MPRYQFVLYCLGLSYTAQYCFDSQYILASEVVNLQYVLILMPMACLQMGHEASFSPQATQVECPHPNT